MPLSSKLKCSQSVRMSCPCSVAENRHEQEQERTRTEAVHKVLVAALIRFPLYLYRFINTPFLDMEKAVNRKDQPLFL